MHTGKYFAKNSYFDRTFNMPAVKILPGEYHATNSDTMIVTVLGSCVSVCIRDRISGIGGMNHYMLPGDSTAAGAPSPRYGTHAMELLIDHLVHLGGRLPYLEAKVFGAGRVINGVTDVGERNAEFALHYLEQREIPVTAVDVGDIYPRKVYYAPTTGRAFVRQIRNIGDADALFIGGSS
ncbi:MAG: chemoreceptor glutamine deamidase CheD [Desulfuromonadales bacterium]|nr:MAG: chemoreceptor glutamine deamidase CheD [Desulfuromonadales bacterium]